MKTNNNQAQVSDILFFDNLLMKERKRDRLKGDTKEMLKTYWAPLFFAVLMILVMAVEVFNGY